MLLNVKEFLRKAYCLSEARINEYLPSEKERIHEKGISIADGTSKFSAPVSPIFSIEDGNEIDWNTAIRTYTMFRVLMREGDVDAELHFDESATKKVRTRKHNDGPEKSPVPAEGRQLARQRPLSQVSPEE